MSSSFSSLGRSCLSQGSGWHMGPYVDRIPKNIYKKSSDWWRWCYQPITITNSEKGWFQILLSSLVPTECTGLVSKIQHFITQDPMLDPKYGRGPVRSFGDVDRLRQWCWSASSSRSSVRHFPAETLGVWWWWATWTDVVNIIYSWYFFLRNERHLCEVNSGLYTSFSTLLQIEAWRCLNLNEVWDHVPFHQFCDYKTWYQKIKCDHFGITIAYMPRYSPSQTGK